MSLLVTIVGARPQFIKAGPVSAAWRQHDRECLVHTGQHYDEAMSDVFFAELGLPTPDAQLRAGSGTHGAQTGRMLESIEQLLMTERPDAVLVYGDTNSTLAGALAAAKLGIPVAHVEAGLRSFDRRMPEELNRVVTDHLATWHFCPSAAAAAHLAAEGVTGEVHVVGDVMLDALESARARAQTPQVLATYGLTAGAYAVATVHRAENTDDPARLAAILDGLGRLPWPVLLPMHPRTRGAVERLGLRLPPSVRVVAPLGYLETVALLAEARVVCTDSGGMQKEAYWLGTPCVTMRDTTEWTETIERGWNVLAGADAARIAAAAIAARRPDGPRDAYGTAGASMRIVRLLRQALAARSGAATPALRTAA